jgi:ABC-2 type transport system ATP-binding protein
MQRAPHAHFSDETHHVAERPLLLEFEHVTKFYGAVIGINNVTCHVGPGITGLLGANGAGKSTLIKLASGQLRPTQGRVTIGGHDAWSTAAKHHLGYSPDINSFYEEMTGREFVYAMARLHGFSRTEARERTEHVLDEVGMADRAQRRLAGCSHGMRQRIKLAQALVHDPWLLLLDEPLTGIAAGTPAEVRQMMQHRPQVIEIVAEPSRRVAALLAEHEDVLAVEMRDPGLVIKTRNPLDFFARVGELVCEQGIEVRRIQILDAGADAVFDYLQQGK